jgi:cobalt transporter subunit CbtB
MMATRTLSLGTLRQALLSAMTLAVLGAALLFVAGHAQSATLHDAAHDVRHANGFPCH